MAPLSELLLRKTNRRNEFSRIGPPGAKTSAQCGYDAAPNDSYPQCSARTNAGVICRATESISEFESVSQHGTICKAIYATFTHGPIATVTTNISRSQTLEASMASLMWHMWACIKRRPEHSGRTFSIANTSRVPAVQDLSLEC